jgi:hypothetical protein
VAQLAVREALLQELSSVRGHMNIGWASRQRELYKGPSASRLASAAQVRRRPCAVLKGERP